MSDTTPKRQRSPGLGGLWTGFYAYDLTEDAIMFTAWIKEEDGRISGSILEENMTTEGLDEEYEAEISGTRHGLDVHFTKTATSEFTMPLPKVRYQGDTDSDCCVISGVWYFDDPSDWTGTFMMTRISGELKASIIAGASNDVSDGNSGEGLDFE